MSHICFIVIKKGVYEIWKLVNSVFVYIYTSREIWGKLSFKTFHNYLKLPTDCKETTMSCCVKKISTEVKQFLSQLGCFMFYFWSNKHR